MRISSFPPTAPSSLYAADLAEAASSIPTVVSSTPPIRHRVIAISAIGIVTAGMLGWGSMFPQGKNSDCRPNQQTELRSANGAGALSETKNMTIPSTADLVGIIESHC